MRADDGSWSRNVAQEVLRLAMLHKKRRPKYCNKLSGIFLYS